MPHYTRNAPGVLAQLKETTSGQLVTMAPCHIQIPHRFEERGLASLGSEIYIYGVYSLIIDTLYAVSNMTAMIRIEPAKTVIETIDGVPYYDFHFDAGQVIIPNLSVIQRDQLIFNILEELIIKGNVPWYMAYQDLGRLFDTAQEYAGSLVGEMPEVIELVASLIARQPADRKLYYRLALEKPEDLKTRLPDYIPLTSVFYAATNTLNKLAGSYFSEGVVGALVTQTEEVERLESILRK